jgi:tRNA threonylcarbamoyladenosine biosynthesis protein TsaE
MTRRRNDMTEGTIEYEAADEAAQLAWGAALADALGGVGGLVCLFGDLGAGKTTLVRGLLRALGHSGPVRSPTYTLIETYDTASVRVHHLDLYRLADAEELEYLGIRDLFDGSSLVLVEWPERGIGVLPEPDLGIRIDVRGRGRLLRFDPSPRWRGWFAPALSAAAPGS